MSVAGAFGVARLIFQNGDLSGLLHFQPQGFVDAWGPLFFGAMVFGVAMDYTLFMLSAAKENYETHADPEHAMVGSVRTSGRVVHLGGRSDGRGVPDLRSLGSARTQGDGRDPGRRGRPRRARRPPGAASRRASLGRHQLWHQPRWLGRILPTVRFSH